MKDFLQSQGLKSLTKQLSAIKRHYKEERPEIKTYMKGLAKYKKAINDYLISTKYENKEDNDNEVTESEPIEAEATEVEGEGIKKRNGYKIVNSKYNNKLLINMPKLTNEMILEAKLGNDILYTNKGIVIPLIF